MGKIIVVVKIGVWKEEWIELEGKLIEKKEWIKGKREKEVKIVMSDIEGKDRM